LHLESSLTPKIKTAMPSSSGKKSTSLAAIDPSLSRAGLARTLHHKAKASVPVRQVRNVQFEPTDAEELMLAAPVPRRAANGAEWLPVSGWNFSWLWAGFSTRKGGLSRAYCAQRSTDAGARGLAAAAGELNLGFTDADDRKCVLANRRSLAKAVTSRASTPLISLRQVHSNRIVQAVLADAARDHPHKADGQMTDEPGLLIAVQTADCIPVLVADRKRRAVAAFHAGWRGTVNRIVESGVGSMRLTFGSQPEDLIAVIGPGIGLCCYAVGEEVLSAFESQFAYARDLFREVYDSDPVRRKYPMLFLTQRAPGHSPIGPSLHVDLVEANRRQLLSAGLSPQSIQVVGGCTQCHTDLFFSHRASHGHTGRMMAVIGIREARKHSSR
jgi:polyphenol oxidase